MVPSLYACYQFMIACYQDPHTQALEFFPTMLLGYEAGKMSHNLFLECHIERERWNGDKSD